MSPIIKGQVYYADLDPTIGSEQRGLRPVLIIQNDVGNKHSPTTIIAPISTKKDCFLPTHVEIRSIKELKLNSIVLLEQTRVIDKIRLKNLMGVLSKQELYKIDKAINIAMGLGGIK